MMPLPVQRTEMYGEAIKLDSINFRRIRIIDMVC